MLNDDVIRIICSKINRKSAWFWQKDLLSLGLVSRIFLEPALDALWKSITHIKPLLSVLPETTLVNGQKMFLGPIAPSSWDRLHYYTFRVRGFYDVDPPGGKTIHDSVYAYLGKEKPIFPKLRKLNLSYQSCSSNTFTLFLAPSLQVASWPSGWEPDDSSWSDLGPSLALLVSKSPGLRSLTLNASTYSALSHSLKHLSALEYLSVRHLAHLEVDFIQAITLSPNLTTLYLSIPPGVVLDYTGVQGGFPSLTKIKLWGSTSETRKFIAVTRPQSLQELFINWCSKPVEDQSLLPDITYLPSFLFLRHLEIEGDAILSLQMNLDDIQLWLIFEPLLELKRLEHLRYDIPLPVSDQRTARIASAWPHLKYLYLNSARGLLSLESLAHFARHCPNLVYLIYSIQLQTETATTLTTVIQIHPSLSMHPLRWFWCNVETDIMTAHAMALGLYQIFPNLQSVTGPGGGWQKVQKILESLRDRQSEE